MPTSLQRIQGTTRRLNPPLAGIGGRLLTAVVLTAVIVTAVVSSVYIWMGYRADLRALDAEIEHLRRADIHVIARALWDQDDAQLQRQLDGIVERPFIASVAVRARTSAWNDGAVLARVGRQPRADSRIEVLPLSYLRDGENAELGTLTVEIDLDAVREAALARAFNFLLVQGGITLLISLVLLLVVRQIVTRHLAALADAAQRFDLRDERTSFRVRPRDSGHGDEIDRVIDALEAMRSSLNIAYRDLANVNAELQTDITARLRAEAAADFLANHDALTNLPNRRLFFQRLEHELAVAERNGTRGAMMFIDLDHFKALNDARGHSMGDAVLIEVARRLREHLREIDLVARLGGDEFVAVLPMLGEAHERATQNAKSTAENLRLALGEPILVRDNVLQVSASFGVAMFPDDGNSPESLIKHADTAMYQAKINGRNTIHFFQRELLAALEERKLLELDLRKALAENALDIAYQPLVDAHGGVRGAEALIRWTHPSHGPISPAQFIPICEESGLIIRLGEWMLRAVLRQIQIWLRAGLLKPPQSISINVSPRQFRQLDFEDHLLAALREFDVPPPVLVLEITEGVVIDNVEHAIERMSALRAHGLRFYLDDFGTGYSSMAYLKRLPVDGLKIDKGFIHDLDTDANDAAIVDAILAMGRHFDLIVVAEGVETEAQAQYLIERDCALLQGYHIGRPTDAVRFAESFLRRHTPV